MKILLLDLILLASAGTVAYGLWLYSDALAYIVCGCGVGVAAFVTGVSIGAKHRERAIQRRG